MEKHGNTNSTVKIIVNAMTANPTKLWEKLYVHQKKVQKKLNALDFTAVKPRIKDHTRFVLISDTHNKTKQLDLPEGDVLIHAGDFSNVGKVEEIDHFNEFLNQHKNKYKHIIVISGNHELSFDPITFAKNSTNMYKTNLIGSTEIKKRLKNCTYIEDEALYINGFKIYGSPWQPEFGGWAYNLERGEKCLEKWNMIPDDTDILITHGPPLGYGDCCSSGLRAGCAELLSSIQLRIKPKLHVFGHIHEAYGVWTDGTTTFVNASICDLQYKPSHLPIIVDLKTPIVQHN
ncbi:metallophosphoesterase domain-containing protein 1 isoform X1 [Hydra vulgaris]|uniref:metallophosphoesterase domain-containing protein 1 isoform X1 n=1 Tax=Hydra vulgaris TaxID=6087 RepID=UPI001F5F5DEB|nr:metallophosphoesterase domain-containing protein 1 [Hydra vulgaris]